jgi:hypothetical protein
MKRYAFVGCGAKKCDGETPARDKYTSDYFREKRRYAEQRCIRWWILSAEHGLIRPSTVIDDYDTHIDDVDIEWWLRDVRLVIHADDSKWYACDELVVLAGQKYVNPLREELDELPCDVRYPFDDTAGIGEQRAWLKDAIQPGEQAELGVFA